MLLWIKRNVAVKGGTWEVVGLKDSVLAQDLALAAADNDVWAGQICTGILVAALGHSAISFSCDN